MPVFSEHKPLELFGLLTFWDVRVTLFSKLSKALLCSLLCLEWLALGLTGTAVECFFERVQQKEMHENNYY